uniref:Uncharacterized protein n=1 Tax=Pseudomonas phage RVTF4 TaxID=3236931 RepID=A0AB39CCW6_9VIRU
MNQEPIDVLREAWRAGLVEFLSMDEVGEKSQLTNLLQVIRNVRYHNLLREGKNESFVRRVYDDIRNVPDFYLLFMSAATTFNLALGDIEGSLDYFCARVIQYSDKSNVVDQMTLSRRAPDTALKTILQQNQWLFMPLLASTLESVTIEVMLAMGRKAQ